MHTLKFFVRLLSLAGVLFLFFWLGKSCSKSEDKPKEAEVITTHSMVLQEVTAMGKLELVKYNFKDVVEHEIVKQWLPNPRAILIVSGEAVGCLDLTKISVSDITETKDTVLIYLPEPELCVNKINHAQSRVYDVQYAMFEEAQLVNEAYIQAEKQIKQSAVQMGILRQTRENAEKILKPLLEKVSKKTVVLRYRLPPAKIDRPGL